MKAPPAKVHVTFDEIKFLSNMSKSSHRPIFPIPSRPSPKTLNSHFSALLTAALSDEPKQRQLAEQQWHAMHLDPDNQTFSLILGAALFSKYSRARKVMECVEQIIGSHLSKDQDNIIQKYQHDLQSCLDSVVVCLPNTELQTDPPPNVNSVERLPPAQTLSLPQKPPTSASLVYRSSHSSMDIPRFKRLFARAFTSVPSKVGKKVKPFLFETNDPWLQKSMQELNEDYLAGVDKNRSTPRYTLKKGQRVYTLLKVHKKAIAKEFENLFNEGVEKTERGDHKDSQS